MTRRSLALCVVATFLMISTTAAQNTPPQVPRPGPVAPGGGPGRGPGGFGFPGGPGGFFPPDMQSAATALMGMPEVQNEIGIRPNQTSAVNALVDELQQQTREQFNRLNPRELSELSLEAREKRMAEFRKKIDEAGAKIDGRLFKLLDAGQMKRLRELQLQRAGGLAFIRPEVQKKLQLTGEQKHKIGELVASPQGNGPPPFPQDRERKLAEALEILTEAQNKTWKEMTGPAFEFPASRGFPSFGPGGPGGFPGGPSPARKIVKDFDKDADGRLNREERNAAREDLKKSGQRGRGFGPPPGGGPGNEPSKPGSKVSSADVPVISPQMSLYDPSVLRILFLEFESDDWEKELADFKGTDVDVPAKLLVDGKTYPGVGVHFRGMSSFMMVREGSKRSLNVSIDFTDPEQRLMGYKTLNLLNSNTDPTFLHTVLYFEIARRFIPAPKANLVKVVINGESWGVYVNAQQFDKTFLKENYSSSKGTRWKVPGRPGGRGGLEYVGENIEDYKRNYELKTDDGEKAWRSLITLCRTLKETPVEQLEQSLDPILDVEGALWFLALDCAFVNEDGYWTRASDYSLFCDEKGKFHIIPHDANETFHAGGFGPGGPGFGMSGPGDPSPGGSRPRGDGPEGPRDGQANPNREADAGRGPPRGPPGPPGGGPGNGFQGVDLDPLVALNDPGKPLRSRLLAVPKFRALYLQHVHTLAEEWMNWEKVGPIVKRHETLISREVDADTRKLSSFKAFQTALQENPSKDVPPRNSLRRFLEERRRYLLSHLEVKNAMIPPGSTPNRH